MISKAIEINYVSLFLSLREITRRRRRRRRRSDHLDKEAPVKIKMRPMIS